MTILDNPTLRDKLMNQFHIEDCFESMTGLNFDLVNFSTDEFIIKEGSNVDYMYFLLVGRVKFFSCSTRREFSVSYMNNGLIGDAEFVTGRMATRSVQVVGDALCMRLSTSRGRHRLMSDRTFLRFMTQQLAEKLTNAEAIAQDIDMSMSTEERLLEYLKISAVENGRIAQSLGEISQVMGVSYRHLIRMMNELCETGKLRHGTRKGAYFLK